MEERAYPREWFCLASWSIEPMAKVFTHESASRIYAGKKFRAKKTQYETWYPTREEAEAVIAQRLENKKAREANDLVRDAAQDMLTALEHILSGALSLPRFAELEARAAIAKAKGLATDDTSCNKPTGEAITESDIPY